MEPEIEMYCRAISASLSRLISCVEGLNDRAMDWRPDAPETNSLAVLAAHVMGNAEENVVEIACGKPVSRDRDAEFSVKGGSAGTIAGRARQVGARIHEALDRLSAAELDIAHEHPRRGRITAREALLVAARHAAEHVGQMELTRDLFRAEARRG